MNIAYLISAHTDAPQLRRLVAALQPDAHFFIHIDRKTDIAPFEALLTGGNIHFVTPRTDVRWGTILEVDYQMTLIRSALDYPLPFDRLVTLSGLDYPLWNPGRITRWMEELGDREVLSGIRMDTPDISPQQRTLYRTPRPFFHLPVANKTNQRLSVLARILLRAIGVRKPLHLIVDGQRWPLYKGSAWWCVSSDLAAHVYHTYSTTPAIRRYFASSFGPAETVVQTIAFNSPQWRGRCLLHTGAYPGLAALTPLHHIVYDPVIKVMDETDLPALMASGRMFTRKLVSGTSDRLIEALPL